MVSAQGTSPSPAQSRQTHLPLIYPGTLTGCPLGPSQIQGKNPAHPPDSPTLAQSSRPQHPSRTQISHFLSCCLRFPT